MRRVDVFVVFVVCELFVVVRVVRCVVVLVVFYLCVVGVGVCCL